MPGFVGTALFLPVQNKKRPDDVPLSKNRRYIHRGRKNHIRGTTSVSCPLTRTGFETTASLDHAGRLYPLYVTCTIRRRLSAAPSVCRQTDTSASERCSRNVFRPLFPDALHHINTSLIGKSCSPESHVLIRHLSEESYGVLVSDRRILAC